ncbi:holo-ACP synthase [Chlamydia gallinacea]|uniref:holo-ACP synthase n=1 Tax=Chlamydia gallinacea TaxID=1457153 RepID=UPI00255C587F|nr:holo-ACP synthase [Chlamydia gallinacea]
MQTTHIGTDIIEIVRIQKAIKTHGQRILNKIFTKEEQKYCLKLAHPYPSFAARFAGKEAVAKALGTGIGKVVGWKDIEIYKSMRQQPEVLLSPKIYEKFKVSQISLSMSHSREYATAVAIILI